ncbi:unnamed protein product [Ceutorhynchus assimilis]|uniref:Uncharacterized protein n=1 Tax=Ceutorhynchus assimilis TaxID=467358 RepID=A0A9N9MFV2_9CUCU|nr:unnamed protein product [Ceutorhynchus assimilis]
MDRNVFKCCKKIFSSFVCIVCIDVFHGSCLDRKSDVVRLGGCRILCSPLCQRSHQIAEEQEENYKGVIDKLRNEITEKESCLKRLKRSSKVFEDDIMETEQSYIGTIEEQKQRIIQLKGEISFLNEANIKLEVDIKNTEERMVEFKQQIQGLTEMSNGMITSIRVLENENRLYLEELSELKQGGTEKTMNSTGIQTDLVDNTNGVMPTTIELLEVEKRMFEDRIAQNVVNEKSSRDQADVGSKNKIGKDNANNNQKNLRPVSSVKKNKLLFLTDEFGKYLYPYLLNQFSSHFEVQVMCKPNALFNSVIKDSCLADFNKSDFVIVLAGTNNYNIKLNDITKLANQCFYTNLILCTVPAKHEDGSPFKGIEIVNRQIVTYVSNLRKFSNNINYVDLYNKFRYSDYVSRNVFLNSKGLSKMAIFIHAAVDGFFQATSFSCLREIRLQASAVSVDEVISSVCNDVDNNVSNIDPTIIVIDDELSTNMNSTNFLDVPPLESGSIGT